MIYFRIDVSGQIINGRPAEEALEDALEDRDPPFHMNATVLEISAPAGTLIDYLITGNLDGLKQTNVVFPDLKARDLSHWIETYGTAAYKKELFEDNLVEEARETLRDVDYRDAPDTSRDKRIADDGDGANQKEKTASLLAGMLDNHGGLCMARSHGDHYSMGGLTELVNKGAVDMLFLEEFTIEEQGEIDAYLNGPHDDLPETLKTKIEVLDLHMVKWEPILKTAREKGIKIYAIDSSEARDIGVTDYMGTEAFGEQRDALMNKVVHDVMERALADPANSGKKFLSVVGAAHANTHRGGIPGVTQMFGVPSIKVDSDGDLDILKEDKSLRGMPSKDEAAYIDFEIMRKYASGDCTNPEDHGARKDVQGQAKLLKEAGALPTRDETLVIRRYIEAANAAVDPAPDRDQLLLAAQRKIDVDKAMALAEFDRLNRDTIVDFNRLLQGNPPNADALREAHDRARTLATKGGLGELLEAVSLMEFVEATLAGTAGPAPVPVNFADQVAGVDALSVAADLLDARTAQDRFGELKTAIAGNDAAEVTRLLQLDPGLVKLTDENGRSIIHLAAKDEKTPILQAISAACPGANFNVPDAKGDAPIHLALRTRRIDREIDDPGDVTAAMKAQDDALAALIAAGANVNAQNAKGLTPLHLTSTNYNTDVLERLFSAGADITAKDNRGWTPLEASMGATSTVIEQMYYDKGVVAPAALCDDTHKKSSIDILCEATLCENPDDVARVRKAYEEAFANPEMRPLLELVALDAASERTPPDSGSRMFIADGSTADSLIRRKEGNHAMGYRGGYDKHAGVVHVSSDTLGVDFAGVLMHELTHRATQIVCGGDVVPYEKSDDLAKATYIGAIEADIARMNLMSPSSPMETEVKRCIMGRMRDYADAVGEDGGDPALLQEFIVSIPQLMASYGPDAVQNVAPALFNQFQGFTEMCQGAAMEDRFDTVRDGMDNSGVVVTERDYVRDPGDSWISNTAPEMGVDALIATMKADYAIHHGEPNPGKTRASDDTGPIVVNAITIKYDVSSYRIPAAQSVAVDAKFDAVKAALNKSLAPNLMTLPLSPDDYKHLIHDVMETAHSSNQREIEKAVEKQAGVWLANAKKRYLDDKIQRGERLTDQEIAETVALAAEMTAAADVDAYAVDTKKHLSMISKLTKFLGDLDDDRKNTMELQKTFIERAVSGMVGDDKSAVRIKTGRKLFGTRDPSLVSIDVSKAKSAWVKAARSMV